MTEKMLSLHVFESVGEFSFREVLPTDPVNLVANYAHVLRLSSLLDVLDLRTTSALTHLNTLESISAGQGACDIQSSRSQMLSLTLRRSRLIRFSHRVKWSAVSNRPQLGQPECLSAVPFHRIPTLLPIPQLVHLGPFPKERAGVRPGNGVESGVVHNLFILIELPSILPSDLIPKFF